MITRVSTQEGRRLLLMQKPHKYHAKPVVVDGVRFDSTREAREWSRLLLWQQCGIISGLERQPVFELHAPNGEVIGKYIGDFRFVTNDGRRNKVVVVDVKGAKTLPLARWKQKHVRAEYGIEVEERR